MINKRVYIYDACLGRMCISLIKNLEKKSIVFSLKKNTLQIFMLFLALAGAIDQFSLKSVTFFQILAGRRSSYGNQEEEIRPQTSPPLYHCVLCKKSLRELAVFKRFAVLSPLQSENLIESVCKVSKIFHCIFIKTENGAIFVPVSG